jgi:hypothetical protein
MKRTLIFQLAPRTPFSSGLLAKAYIFKGYKNGIKPYSPRIGQKYPLRDIQTCVINGNKVLLEP